MVENDGGIPPRQFGNWEDAETLRRWSFARRSPQQRLDWLVAALTIRYEAADTRPCVEKRVKLGSALATLAKPFGGLDLDVSRDQSRADPPIFE